MMTQNGEPAYDTIEKINATILKLLMQNRGYAKQVFVSSELQRLSKQMANGKLIEQDEIIGLYDGSIANSFSGNFSGILFLRDRIYVNLNKSSISLSMRYEDMVSISGDPSAFFATLTLTSSNGDKILLKGISYTTQNVYAAFKNIIKAVKENKKDFEKATDKTTQSNQREASKVSHTPIAAMIDKQSSADIPQNPINSPLTEYQFSLIDKYLVSNIFKGSIKDTEEGSKALMMASNMKEVSSSGSFICTYGGLFGLGSTIKNVSFFSKDTLYFKNAQESQAIIIPYNSIQKIIHTDKDKTGTLLYNNSKCVDLPKRTIIALKGFEVIRKMDSNTRNLLGEFIISQEEKIFGEYSTFYMPNLFKNYFKKGDILDWIPCRCTITEVSVENIIIKITVTDKDYDYFSSEEWENAVNQFSTREDILIKIKEQLSFCLCWDYSIEQIVFLSRFKKSISKAVSNGLNNVTNVASTVYEHLETTAYYEAAQNSRLKADIIKKTKGTDNDEYSENIDKYNQYMETYRERTALSKEENECDYLYEDED